jgi:hypothetical protein
VSEAPAIVLSAGNTKRSGRLPLPNHDDEEPSSRRSFIPRDHHEGVCIRCGAAQVLGGRSWLYYAAFLGVVYNSEVGRRREEEEERGGGDGGLEF